MKRTLVHLASLFPGASLGLVVPARPQEDSRPVQALAISRTDFALTRAIRQHMKAREAANDYEHMVISGAPLSAVTPQFPEWSQTFHDHVELVTRPRRIKHVLLVDHDPAVVDQLRSLGDGIKARNAELRVEAMLLDESGTLQPVQPQ